MTIHFFTVVCNGMPFIRRHLRVFERLKMPWHWHICEGASHTHDGAPAPVTNAAGMSTDGTTEYLDSLAAHPHVTVTRDTRHYLTWRCNEMLRGITEECLAWQVDVDEFWTASQIETMYAMFCKDRRRLAAQFWCNYFVGPGLVLERKEGAGNYGRQEWLRVWRWEPGCAYAGHDPPFVVYPVGPSFMFSYTRDETAAAGLIFNHYAFVREAQVEFKACRYGWPGAVDRWRALQVAALPAPIEKFMPWLGRGTVVREKPEDEFKEE